MSVGKPFEGKWTESNILLGPELSRHKKKIVPYGDETWFNFERPVEPDFERKPDEIVRWFVNTILQVQKLRLARTNNRSVSGKSR
jgi:hypothetical protein